MNSTDFNHLLFKGSIIFIHIAYLALFFGILYIDESYIRYFSTFIQLGVCLFLIIRFFPLRKSHEVTKLDVSIIFYCATFLLMNVVFIELYTILPRNIVSDTIYKLVEKK
jgi:4-amino-4-deoxy-L-arabinose transferase-like glycosyltransferase